MRIIVIFFLCLLSLQSFAKRSKWSKHYNLVLKDIRSVEKIKNRELPLRVRLFELYGEKLQLLLQKENEYRIKFLNTGKGKALTAVLKKQKHTLKSLDTIAVRIERLTKNTKILAKINYYRSLNYMLVKKKKLFYKYIKLAEELNKDKELGYQINIRLADHYYNEKMYSHSTVYYKKVLDTKKDQWATKFYYNLAWSHLKLEQYNKALRNIKMAHVYEKKKGYFKIGDQLVDGILLFYAFSKRTKEGLLYLKEKNIDTFENLISYLNYVFKSGEKGTVDLVIGQLLTKKRSMSEEYKLTTNLIEIYRNLKKYNSLQKYLLSFKKNIFNKKVLKEGEIQESLVTSLKGYSGYLQKITSSSGLHDGKKESRFVRYISFNFDLLSIIDEKNKLEYSFYKGETYFTVSSFNKAILTYLVALKKQKKIGKKNKFIRKSFDSLFKAIEKQKKVKGATLVSSFTTYLYYFPNRFKAAEIYRRLIAFYRSSGKQKQLFLTLRKYNKYYPKNVIEQREVYGSLVDSFVSKKNLGAIVSLKKFIDKGFLGYTKKESTKLKKIISEIYFSKYEGMAKKGEYSKAIVGFGLLFNDKKSSYELRVDSLRKKMFYQSKAFVFEGLADSLVQGSTFFDKKTKNQFKEELMFYLQSVCINYEELSCIKAYETFAQNGIRGFTKELETLYFKQKLVFTPKADYKLSSNSDLNNYLFKVLLLDDPSFSSPLFNSFLKDNTKREIITNELEKRILQYFYKNLDLNQTEKFISGIKIKPIRDKHLRLVQNVKKTLETSKLTLPLAPKIPEMTEDSFGNLGNNVMKSAQNNSTLIQMAIKNTGPNYLPFVLSKFIHKLETITSRFKKFIPISKNPELEKAMNEEISNIHKYFDNQIVEYRNLYYRSLSATIVGSGARFYSDDIILDKKSNSMGEIKLWSSY